MLHLANCDVADWLREARWCQEIEMRLPVIIGLAFTFECELFLHCAPRLSSDSTVIQSFVESYKACICIAVYASAVNH